MLEIQKLRCDQSLFGPNKIVSDERREDIIADCIKTGGYFNCHKARVHDYKDGQLCCRGWLDLYGPGTQMVRIAQRLDAIKYVTVPEEG